MSGRLAATGAMCAAVATLVVGVVFGTHVAGGSDSSCYLNAARLLSRGDVALNQPLVRDAPWDRAADTFTPAGFVPSPVDPTRIVPICSPGLPLAMALFRALHLNEFLVVPLLGALSVWLTFRIGVMIADVATGVFASLLLLCSPTFLYQLVQPMSDVPATAWWLLAIVFALEAEARRPHRPVRAGAAAGLAVLTRPNLFPLALVIAVYLAAVSLPERRRPRLLAFTAGLVPGLVTLAALQHAMYGSALATGYGDTGSLMALDHVAINIQRYTSWLLGTHTPVLLLAVASPVILRQRRHAWLCLAFVATAVACYLPYLTFDAWWYTRFLLPAIPLLIVLTVAAIVAIVARVAPRRPPGFRIAIASACLVTLMAVWTWTARDRHAFDLSSWEQHYYRAGTAVARHVTGPAAVVTVRNSGSVQYHAGASTLSWDTIAPATFDGALGFVRAHGLEAYLLFEGDEEPVFRARFRGNSELANLDWPPKIQVGRTIRLYDPRDRQRFLADGNVRTEYLPESPAPLRDWRRWLRADGAE